MIVELAGSVGVVRRFAGAFVPVVPVVTGSVVTVGVVVAVVVVVVAVVVVVVAVAAAHVGTLIVLLLRVTAPVWASSRPCTLAPLFNVTDVCARIVPTKDVVVPKVAELPTCQKTLHACAPSIKTTELPEAVVNVDPA